VVGINSVVTELLEVNCIEVICTLLASKVVSTASELLKVFVIV